MNPRFDSHPNPRQRHWHSESRGAAALDEEEYVNPLPPRSPTTDSWRADHELTRASIKKKSVQFLPECEMWLIPSHRELTDDEYLGTYYTEADRSAIMMENVEIIRSARRLEMMQQLRSENMECDNEEDEDLCIRGLEAMTDREALEHRRAVKQGVVDAVLDEQERQYRLLQDEAAGRYGSDLVTDPEEEIAFASRSCSAVTILEAVDRATADATFVRREAARARERSIRALRESAGRLKKLEDQFLSGVLKNVGLLQRAMHGRP